jgi:hypothetical protein
MTIEELQEESKEIWPDKANLSEIVTRLGVIFGDICRYERNEKKDLATHNDSELQKEFGNLIFSSIKWCSDLGYSPEECVNKAIDCQKKFVSENR